MLGRYYRFDQIIKHSSSPSSPILPLPPIHLYARSLILRSSKILLKAGGFHSFHLLFSSANGHFLRKLGSLIRWVLDLH